MIRSWTISIALAGALATSGGCKKGSEDGGGAKTEADAAAAAETEADAAAPAEARRVRLFDCKHAGFTGEGEKREVSFDLTNRGDATSKAVQSWIYYYDEAGKQIARYPHKAFISLEPGGNEKKSLGFSGAKIPAEAKTIECEVSEVDLDDGTSWENQNLVYNKFSPRPLGGESEEKLRAREGEKVAARWKGNRGEEPTFTLENLTERPLTVKVLWTYYYDAEGKLLTRGVSNLRQDLEPGASLELQTGKKPEDIPEETRHVEATISVLQFRDGDEEEWENRNLSTTDRPMAGAAAEPQ